jgi:hypothetical protein
MRIRQAALVAADLEPVAATLCELLRIGAPFRDPGVEFFGLHNVVLPIGDTFLEVVSPFQSNTTAGRYLDRRGGDGGYMLLVQTDDLDADRARLDDLGVRVVWNADLDDIRAVHLHPRDTGGTLLSLDQPTPPEEWRWGGPGWRDRGSANATALTAVELQSDDPAALAERWAAVLGRAARDTSVGSTIELESGRIRFVAAQDQRGEGMRGIEVRVNDPEEILAAARRRNLPVDDREIVVCGTVVRLV